MKFLEKPEDVQWLHETHLPEGAPGFDSALLRGNEDSPSRVTLYLADEQVGLYLANDEGKLESSGALQASVKSKLLRTAVESVSYVALGKVMVRELAVEFRMPEGAVRDLVTDEAMKLNEQIRGL